MSFPRYEAYRDSGIEWLGELPKHWIVCALGYSYEVQLGKMLDEKRITGKHLGPYLRNVDVQWGRINVSDLPEMDFREDDIERFSLRKGDLLVCEGGEVGRAAVWNNAIDTCFFQKALHRLRPYNPKKNDTFFFFYVMKAAADLGVFSGTEGRATIAHLTAEAFRRYRFPFPPPLEQSAIAAFLDRETAKIDALIQEQQRLIELLKEKRQAVISHAVTKGLNPDAPMKDSGVEWLGEVPEHWEVIRFLRAFEVVYRYPTYYDIPYVETGVPEIRGEALTSDGRIVPIDDMRFISNETSAKFPMTQLQLGDFVMSVRGTLGKVGLVTEDFVGANITANLLRLSPKPSGAYNQFLLWFMLSIQFREQLDVVSSQTTIKTITVPQLNCIHFALPTIQEQREICDWLERNTAELDSLLSTAKATISLLQERRSALISAAVTGKIDVRGLVSVEAEAA